MSQMSIDDLPNPARPLVGRYHAVGPDTEREAAALVAPRSGSQRAKVLEALRLEPSGLTDNELHYAHGIGAYPHVAGTRREELISDGWAITDSGRRRRTRAGSPAIVWVLKSDGAARE